jgi:hypothetical protein
VSPACWVRSGVTFPGGVHSVLGLVETEAFDPKRKPTLDLSQTRLSAEATTDAPCGVDPSGTIQSSSEIRIVRSRQPNPLAFIMFDWVLGADLFLPGQEQATIGDKNGERRRKDVRVLHRQFKL